MINAPTKHQEIRAQLIAWAIESLEKCVGHDPSDPLNYPGGAYLDTLHAMKTLELLIDRARDLPDSP